MSTATKETKETRERFGMQVDRKAMLEALRVVEMATKRKTPKPILEHVLLQAGTDFDHAALLMQATDQEVGVRYRLSAGVVPLIAEPVRNTSVVLPMPRARQIFTACRDESMDLKETDDGLELVGDHSRFTLNTEDAATYPVVSGFQAESYRVVAAADLKLVIARTLFATDVESTRYALGGVLFEHDGAGKPMRLVATDGRRLALAEMPVELEGEPGAIRAHTVVPVKALKLLDRLIADDDPPVHVAFDPHGSHAVFRTANAEMYTRLVEGRFPRYEDVFPTARNVQLELDADAFLRLCHQAQVATSQESYGVDFTIESGVLIAESLAADVGKAKVDMGITYSGEKLEIRFDPRYLIEFLKQVAGETMTLELVDGRSAGLFTLNDGYKYVAMPLTRE